MDAIAVAPSRGLSTVGVLVGLAALSLLAAGTVFVNSLSTPPWAEAETWVTKRGTIEVLVPASGELSALNQTEVMNQLEYRAVITEAIPEGTFVKKGDVLLRFKDDEVRKQLKDAEEGVISAESALEGAQADLEIKQRGRESAVAKATVDVELATLALNAWLEGESVSKLEEMQVAVTTAEKSFERQRLRYDSSKSLVQKGFISDDQMRADEIAYIESESRLNKARRDLEVYEKYTYIKERKEHESTLEQARDELVRVQKSQDAEVHKAESNVFAADRQLETQRQWRDKWTEQLDNCTVTAPQDGLVVYASSLEEYAWMRYNNMAIQPGSEVYHNQLLMVLPDTSQMVASIKVNEAISGSISPGQSASVTCDAAPGRIMKGTVQGISILAESGQNWHNRKEYTVRVLLDDVGELDLKPGMRCTADIETGRVEDVLHVPIHAVHHEGDAHFVYVPIAGGCAQRRVTVGKGSDLYIEIASGLAAGDSVLLTAPNPEDIIERLEGLPPTEVDDEPLLATEDGAGDAPDGAADAPGALATHESSPPAVVTDAPVEAGPAESTGDAAGDSLGNG